MLRVLLLADTHIGFDHPLRPRVQRPRRGPELLDAFREVLGPAHRGAVDVVVHGGDLFHRSRPPAAIVRLALEPLLEVADRGTPVVLVPGNHERSSLPMPMLALHPDLHVLDSPRTVSLGIRDLRVAVGGFPFIREVPRRGFRPALDASGLLATEADIRLLAVHQAFEGASVGPVDFTFRRGADVIAGSSIPVGLAAVLSGHIHRRQRLEIDLGGQPLAAPVLYPGSVGRTSFAERFEPKGAVVARFEPDSDGGRLAGAEFRELPTRPMEVLTLAADELTARDAECWLRTKLQSLPSDSVVQVRLRGAVGNDLWPLLRAERLRAMAPPTMIVELSVPNRRPGRSGG